MGEYTNSNTCEQKITIAQGVSLQCENTSSALVDCFSKIDMAALLSKRIEYCIIEGQIDDTHIYTNVPKLTEITNVSLSLEEYYEEGESDYTVCVKMTTPEYMSELYIPLFTISKETNVCKRHESHIYTDEEQGAVFCRYQKSLGKIHINEHKDLIAVANDTISLCINQGVLPQYNNRTINKEDGKYLIRLYKSPSDLNPDCMDEELLRSYTVILELLKEDSHVQTITETLNHHRKYDKFGLFPVHSIDYDDNTDEVIVEQNAQNANILRLPVPVLDETKQQILQRTNGLIGKDDYLSDLEKINLVANKQYKNQRMVFFEENKDIPRSRVNVSCNVDYNHKNEKIVTLTLGDIDDNTRLSTFSIKLTVTPTSGYNILKA